MLLVTTLVNGLTVSAIGIDRSGPEVFVHYLIPGGGVTSVRFLSSAAQEPQIPIATSYTSFVP